MNKKILITVITILLLVAVLTTFFILTTKDKNKVDNNKLETNQISFTIGDKGTEIEIEIKNNNNFEVNIKKVIANIYDENNKKIGTITKETDTKLKSHKKQKFKLISENKYVNASQIKYKIN